MKLAQRQLGEGNKRRTGRAGQTEAPGRKPVEHVEYDGDMSSASIVSHSMSSTPASAESEAELYRGKSDGEILARYEF